MSQCTDNHKITMESLVYSVSQYEPSVSPILPNEPKKPNVSKTSPMYKPGDVCETTGHILVMPCSYLGRARESAEYAHLVNTFLNSLGSAWLCMNPLLEKFLNEYMRVTVVAKRVDAEGEYAGVYLGIQIPDIVLVTHINDGTDGDFDGETGTTDHVTLTWSPPLSRREARAFLQDRRYHTRIVEALRKIVRSNKSIQQQQQQ